MGNWYYVALVAPAQINDFKSRVQQRLRIDLGLSSASRSPAHVTLMSPLELGGRKALELEERFLALGARDVLKPVTATFGTMTTFEHANQEEGLVVLPVLGPATLEAKRYVEAELGNHGAHWTPHLTLAKVPLSQLQLAFGEAVNMGLPMREVTFYRMALFRKRPGDPEEVANVPFAVSAQAAA